MYSLMAFIPLNRAATVRERMAKIYPNAHNIRFSYYKARIVTIYHQIQCLGLGNPAILAPCIIGPLGNNAYNCALSKSLNFNS